VDAIDHTDAADCIICMLLLLLLMFLHLKELECFKNRTSTLRLEVAVLRSGNALVSINEVNLR